MLRFFLLTLIFTGIGESKVTYISDGDTIWVKGINRSIRLGYIDCPETTQPYGLEAKEYLLNRILGEEVSINITGDDRKHDRIIGEVFYKDENLNKTMVEKGYAWVYDYYCDQEPLCSELKALEAKAREQKLGLWKMAKPVEPWVWRRNH